MTQWIRNWSHKSKEKLDKFCYTSFYIQIKINQILYHVFNGGHHLCVTIYGLLLAIVIYICFTYIREIGPYILFLRILWVRVK